MLYFWITLLIILNTFWLALVPFGLPGNWLIVISAALFAWWQRDNNVLSIYTIIVIAVLAFVGELLEFFAGAAGAKKAGAGLPGTIAALFGAVIGAAVGTFIFPLAGTILGACLGAGLAASIVELIAGRTADDSIRSGIGASIGRLFGLTAKLALGAIIWLIVALAAFLP